MATKLARVVTYQEGLPPVKSHMTLWSLDLAKSPDKQKPLYLHYDVAYVHEIL